MHRAHEYFNPHSPCGERQTRPHSTLNPTDFNPHSPCGERLELVARRFGYALFQSTLPLRGATSTSGGSIHSRINFNPHSPCGERRDARRYGFARVIFQSTLPLRGATRNPSTRPRNQQYFNPHSPCGERLCNAFDVASPQSFQSTLPLRGATSEYPVNGVPVEISIHTPLAGSDPSTSLVTCAFCYFNPHSPCGERPAPRRRR